MKFEILGTNRKKNETKTVEKRTNENEKIEKRQNRKVLGVAVKKNLGVAAFEYFLVAIVARTSRCLLPSVFLPLKGEAPDLECGN